MTKRSPFNGLAFVAPANGQTCSISAENFSGGLLDQREPHVPFGKLPALE